MDEAHDLYHFSMVGPLDILVRCPKEEKEKPVISYVPQSRLSFTGVQANEIKDPMDGLVVCRGRGQRPTEPTSTRDGKGQQRRTVKSG